VPSGSGPPPQGYGGRADTNERFVVGGWPHSTDCSLPGGDDENAKATQALGINSIFYKKKQFDKTCNGDLVKIVNTLGANASRSQDFHVLTDDDCAVDVTPAARDAAIDALFIGDEVDGVYDTDHLSDAFSKAMDQGGRVPTVLTFQGSKTTRNVGSFCGITDIQASDAYNAACAPTMLGSLFKLPFLYPYDYLRNARDNQVPGQFWGYSQLYSDAWSYQANANELIAQVGQAILAGSKGLMFFQTYVKFFEQHKVKQIGDVVRSVAAVGNIIREGDIGGMVAAVSSSSGSQDSPTAVVEVIRSPDQVLIVLLNTNAAGYSNLVCHTGLLDRHWTFHDTTVDKVTLSLNSAPGVTTLSNWREAVGGSIQPLSDVSVSSSTGEVQLKGIDLTADIPVRLLLADIK